VPGAPVPGANGSAAPQPAAPGVIPGKAPVMAAPVAPVAPVAPATQPNAAADAEAEGGEKPEGEGGEGVVGLDDDFDDESNLSLSAMEAALKPQVLATLDQIAALYKRLGKPPDRAGAG